MKQLIKKVYKWMPFKKEIFSVLRKIWTPSERLFKHLYFKGIFSIPVNNNASFKMKHYGYQLETEIFWRRINGNWEKYSLVIWQKLSEKADVVFDIGANTGIYSLLTKTINPKANVQAFEPMPKIFEKLHMNIQINNFDIQCHEIAASDNTGTAMIYDVGAEHDYAASITNRHSFTNATEIRTTKLDDFIQSNDILHVDLLKIDVEGHEPEVLSGFSNGLAKFKPSMLIEILTADVANKINIQIDGLGYHIYSIDEEKGLTRLEEIKVVGGYNFLICQPSIANYLGLNAS